MGNVIQLNENNTKSYSSSSSSHNGQCDPIKWKQYKKL